MTSFTSSRIVRALARRAGFTRALVAAGLVGLSTAACDVHGISDPGSLAQIVVSPDPQTLAVNGTQQFSAVGMDYEGRVVSMTPTWSIASGGGTISASGLFTAGATPGTYASTVKATSGALSDAATVVVIPGPLASIVVTPNPVTLGVGATQQFTAVGKDAAGNVVQFTPTWSLLAGGGTISSTGLFTAGTLASTFANTVQASNVAIKGTATVTVTPGPLAAIVVTPNPTTLNINLTQQLTAVGRDANGNAVAITPVWSVAAGGGTIGTTGLFKAGTTPGTFANTVRATSGGFSGTATVIVTPGALASILVTPNPASMVIGTTQQFLAVGRDASGNIVQFSHTWSVVTGGGSVNGTGLFTAGLVTGTFANTIQVSSGGLTGTATVIVTPGPLASIAVTPNPTTLDVGLTQQLTAVGRDASGNTVAITPVWSVAAGGGAVSGAGLFTAGSTPGTFTNTAMATSGSISGTATVIVTAGVLATITVTPHPATVGINTTQQFTAVGRDAGGNVVAITPTWATVAGGGAINLSTGLFTAGATTGTFTSTVRASVGALAGFATVNVTSGPLASITVTPTPVSVQTNGTQQFIAVGRDGSGNEFIITPVWSVVAGGGSINATTGVFTAGLVAGSFPATVRATSGAVFGSASVTVTAIAPVLATITVLPNPASVVANGTQQFAAVGRDGLGNIFPISPEWTVEFGGGIINLNTGLFTAGAAIGAFNNTVKASEGAISGSATVNVISGAAAEFVDLGTAAPDGILAGTEVTCTTAGLVNADVAIWAGNAFTPGTCVFNGLRILGVAPADQHQLDLTTAYNILAGLFCPAANVIADVGGTTKFATDISGVNVYCTAGAVLGITGSVTLDALGDPDAVFVFQSPASSLVTAGDVLLPGGGQAKNVYWGIGTSATLGVSSHHQGNILANVSITMVDGATLVGRALARTGAVTLGANTVIVLP